jgi:pimeloyl-ACP methyl ester carboxylesterase
MKRPVIRGLLGLLGLVILAVAVSSAAIHSRWDRAFHAPEPDLKASADSSVIERGRYLVHGPAHCSYCHTPPSDWPRLDAGEERPLVGGFELHLPVGVLFGQLSSRFRTVAPVLPAGSEPGPGAGASGRRADLDDWLRGLIDGLGLERPAVVAGATRGAGLLRFMALDPDRVGRLALVQPTEPGSMVSGHLLLDDPGPPDPHPVLVVAFPGPADTDGRLSALDRLTRFLAASH